MKAVVGLDALAASPVSVDASGAVGHAEATGKEEKEEAAGKVEKDGEFAGRKRRKPNLEAGAGPVPDEEHEDELAALVRRKRASRLLADVGLGACDMVQGAKEPTAADEFRELLSTAEQLAYAAKHLHKKNATAAEKKQLQDKYDAELKTAPAWLQAWMRCQKPEDYYFPHDGDRPFAWAYYTPHLDKFTDAVMKPIWVHTRPVWVKEHHVRSCVW